MMTRLFWILLAFSVPALGKPLPIALQPGVKALLVKVKFSTREVDLKKLAPSDFRVRFDAANQRFRLTREDRAEILRESIVGHEKLAACREEIVVHFPGPALQAETREIPGTAVILVHPNGVDHRELDLGPGLELVTLTQLKP